MEGDKCTYSREELVFIKPKVTSVLYSREDLLFVKPSKSEPKVKKDKWADDNENPKSKFGFIRLLVVIGILVVTVSGVSLVKQMYDMREVVTEQNKTTINALFGE